MMDGVIEFFVRNAGAAHWFIFGAALLAGLNMPVSIDLVMIASALLAATVIPEHWLHLYLALLTGCAFSAWITYWIGRLFGPKLAQIRFFSKILSQEKLNKMQLFYDKYGFFTLLIGRFIPFGVRNCLFMTTGMSKIPFSRFIVQDFIACCIWSTVCFFSFYAIGENYAVLKSYLKTFNLLIFSAFSVTLIGIVWYKKRKRSKPAPSD